MNTADFIAFLVAPLWIAAVIGASVVFRTRRRKAVFPKFPPNALFTERAASGNSHKYWWGRIGGASNCLMVWVTQSELAVTPFFPLNLMFLPEVYGLELTVPRSAIRIKNPAAGFFGRGVLFSVDGPDGYDMILYLRRKQEFLTAIATS